MTSNCIIWGGYFIVYIVFWIVAGGTFMDSYYYEKHVDAKYKSLAIVSMALLVVYTIYLYKVFGVM
jgi:hypothetical protein